MSMTTNEIFLLIALVSSGIFLLQFFISLFLGDVDVDVDGDATADSDLGSVFSFKGLVHFLIGFGWTKVFFVGESWKTYLGAVLVGLVFVFVMFYVYVLAFRLQKYRAPEPPSSMVGRAGKVYINDGDGRYTISLVRDGSVRELDVVSLSGRTDYVTDQVVTIEKFENNTYYIN